MSVLTITGTTFTAVWDRFDGSVGASGGSSGSQPNSIALKLDPGVMLDLENALVDVDGIARMRGSIKASAVGANDITTSTSGVVLAAMRAASYPNTTAGPYIATTVAAGTYQIAPGAPSALSSPSLPVSRSPTLSLSAVVVAGTDVSDVSMPGRVGVQTPGSSGAYSTGTATFTQNSATVTGVGTAWTSAMVGMQIYNNTPASNDTLRTYVIKKVTNSVTLVLATPFLAATSSGVLYNITSSLFITTGTTSSITWGVDAAYGFGIPRARVAVEHASRLFLGWTKEPQNAAGVSPLNDNNVAAAPEYKSRLRWSGIIGSAEGPFLTNPSMAGLFGWTANAYLDLNTRYGGILAMNSYNGGLLAWQEFGMTVIYGTSTYLGPGSLDATTVFENIQINGGFAYEQTEYGVFFVDKKRGPMIYTASGRPTALDMPRSIRERVKLADHVGYVNDHVLFMSSTNFGSANLEFWAYHVRSKRWTRFTNSGSRVLTHPQRSNDHECCALMTTATGSRVVSLDSLTVPDGTVTDTDGTTTYTKSLTIQTGHLGDPTVLLRANKIYLTLRATGTPNTVATVRSGLPNNQDAAHTASNSLEVVATGTSGADVETVWTAVTMDRDPSISVKITDASGTVGHLEIVQVVVEGTVEGRGASS